MDDLNDAFAALNFEIYQGPEISSELFEFDHLNFPPEHPARESMDTFWLAGSLDRSGSERLCLRPHLTGASVRYMREHAPPFRFVYPGRVYRNESTDSRHERAFFQYEALIVDEDVPFTAGKFLVDTILDTVFGHPVQTRMRTGFFPFVEPGFEIDMMCQVCDGTGCSTCSGVGWLEVMPGGSPHPNVLKAGGLDPDRSPRFGATSSRYWSASSVPTSASRRLPGRPPDEHGIGREHRGVRRELSRSGIRSDPQACRSGSH